MPEDADRITIESITSAHVQRVDRAKYMAMREALLGVLPTEAPGSPSPPPRLHGSRCCRTRTSPAAKRPDGGSRPYSLILKRKA